MNFVKSIIIISLFSVTLSGCFLNNEKKSLQFSAFKEKINTSQQQEVVRNTSKVRKKLVKVDSFKAKPKTLVKYKKLNAIEKECLLKYYVGYEYALCLYDKEDLSSAISYLEGLSSSGTESKLSQDLLSKIKTPFKYIIDQSNVDLDKWLLRKSEVGKFNMKPPAKIKNNIAQKLLTKGEFETTEGFNQRVLLAEKEIEKQDHLLEQKYQDKLSVYDQSLSTYNKAIEDEKKDRKERSEGIYLEFVNKYITDVLGRPLVKKVSYNADTETIFLNLTSQKSGFFQLISAHIDLGDAKYFSGNLNKAHPILEFNISREKMSIYKVNLEFFDKVYEAKILLKNSYPHVGVLQKIVKSKFSK